MGFQGFATLAAIFGFVQVIFWLVIGWRAMRAHEEIAASLISLSRHIRLRDERISPGDHGRES